MDLAVVVIASMLALGVAVLVRRVSAGREVTVDGTKLISEPAILVFTAAHCTRCARVLEMVRDAPLPVVEYRAESDGDVFSTHGVDAAPVAVVTGTGGETIAQFAGVPRSRALAKAIERARNTANGG